ncbi:N-acetylglucosamine-6-phosphate deacetylase [Zhihengliuella halotolerans]|uniref:N-acetylglucosamine 6-phosphate deacetylase n=1 Tax=Zhihengliuella halotolerans TaxID=370736 RepID=A0A4Q8ABU9_9MICC|nr:amidohydrolase family protein [Zhihengliuella halotolerans]RZU61660.1 N-acetylglucosamine 6-phosphate deacetylase [Zhihengliuella halotolerans]
MVGNDENSVPLSSRNDVQSQRFALAGTLLTEGDKLPGAVVAVDGDRIEFAGPAAVFAERDDHDSFPLVPLADDALIMPGLIDLHCHGGFGVDFSTAGEQQIREALGRHYEAGTTTLLASLMAAAEEEMLAAAERLGPLVAEGLIAGIHAEGPFLSKVQNGAQSSEALRDPDPDFVEELVAACQGALRTMTYAPELPGADALIEQLVSHGVIPSLGHTGATAEQTVASLALVLEELESAGFDGYTETPTITHVFNGMAPWHHRAPGPVGASLEAAALGRAVLEIIGDGHHLHPQTLRMLFATMPASALALVTDATAATAMPDGDYRLGGQRARLANAVLRTDDGRIAGGSATLLDCVKACVDAGVSLARALTAATTVPAAILGLEDEVGALHAGFRADILVTDDNLQLLAAFRSGQPVNAAA